MILWYYYLTVFLPPLPPAMSQVDTTTEQKRKYGETAKQETCCYHHYYCSKLFNDFTLSVVSFSTLFYITTLLGTFMSSYGCVDKPQSVAKFVKSRRVCGISSFIQRHACIRNFNRVNLQKNIKKRTTDLCIVISIKII